MELSAKATLQDLTTPASGGRPPLAGKTVLLRVNLDVELVENDDEDHSYSVAPADERVVELASTSIQAVLDAGAKSVVVIGHLGPAIAPGQKPNRKVRAYACRSSTVSCEQLF